MEIKIINNSTNLTVKEYVIRDVRDLDDEGKTKSYPHFQANIELSTSLLDDEINSTASFYDKDGMFLGNDQWSEWLEGAEKDVVLSMPLNVPIEAKTVKINIIQAPRSKRFFYWFTRLSGVLIILILASWALKEWQPLLG